MNQGTGFKDPRFLIAYTIILLFSGAYVYKPTETMTGAIIAAFAGAWGYYLGSSRGASQLNDNIGKVADAVTAAANAGASTSASTAVAPAIEPAAAPNP